MTVSLAIFWMAHRQNEQAEEANKTMVLGGISSMEDHVEQFANDYAWWEAGYDAYVKGDRDWVDVNFGSGVTDTQISDIMVIISPEGEIAYGWAIDSTTARRPRSSLRTSLEFAPCQRICRSRTTRRGRAISTTVTISSSLPWPA